MGAIHCEVSFRTSDVHHYISKAAGVLRLQASSKGIEIYVFEHKLFLNLSEWPRSRGTDKEGALLLIFEGLSSSNIDQNAEIV